MTVVDHLPQLLDRVDLALGIQKSVVPSHSAISSSVEVTSEDKSKLVVGEDG